MRLIFIFLCYIVLIGFETSCAPRKASKCPDYSNSPSRVRYNRDGTVKSKYKPRLIRKSL